MKIVISHVYSNKNKGDAALLSVLLNDVRRAFNGAAITILTMDSVGKEEVFEGIPIERGFMYYASSRYTSTAMRLIYGSFITLTTLIWAVVYRGTKKSIPVPSEWRNVISLYQNADLIIPVGGGYLRGTEGWQGTAVLFFIIHPLLVGAILGKPTIGYTQSIGPFGNKLQEWMTRFAINKIDGIIVRESISLALLKRWRIYKHVLLSTDGGFSFVGDGGKDIKEELNIAKRQMMVGITVRDWLTRKEQANYERALAEFCDYLIKRYNAIVVFIPQVTVENHHDDDRISTQRVFDLVQHKDNARITSEEYDYRNIKTIYSHLDYLVGTRFHSVIFALTSYVPAIAIGYEYKTRGIMSDLGLEKWVIDIHNIKSSSVIDLFNHLISDREKYIHQLKKILPVYIKQSEESIYFVKNIYEEIIQKNATLK